MKSTSKRAEQFIRTYLEELENRLNSFPDEVRHLFPAYTHKPHRVKVYVAPRQEVAFWVTREATEWTFIVTRSNKPVLEALGLPAHGRPCIAFKESAAENVIDGLNLLRDPVTQLHSFRKAATFRSPPDGCLFAIEGDSDVQFRNVVFGWVEFRKGGKPPRMSIWQPPLLWIATKAKRRSLIYSNARGRAQRDAAQFTVWAAFRLEPTNVAAEPLRRIIEWLQHTNRQYLSLLGRTDTEEEEVQVYLKRKSFFLDPRAVSIVPKHRIGKFVTDFALLYDDQSYRLVELERPQDEVIGGDHLSARAAHAVRQVRDWMNELTRNPDSMLAGTPLRHWVIIGLRGRMSDADRTQLAAINKDLQGIEVRTYDDLAGNLTTRAQELLQAIETQSPQRAAKPS